MGRLLVFYKEGFTIPWSVMERTSKMKHRKSILDLSYEDLKDDLELSPPCTQ
jgi:hypothetical protein